jgi:hypothetical protein
MFTILIIDDEFNDFQYINQHVINTCNRLGLRRDGDYEVKHVRNMAEAHPLLHTCEQNQEKLILICDLRDVATSMFEEKESVEDFITNILQHPGSYLAKWPLIIFSVINLEQMISPLQRELKNREKTDPIPRLMQLSTSPEEIRATLRKAIDRVKNH